MATPEHLLELKGAPVPGLSGEHPLLPATLADARLPVLRDAAMAAWENRDRFGYAWHLLKQGVCDHCALGPRGLRDDVLPGRHLCLKRLERLRDDTIGAFVPADVRDLRLLRKRSATGLRDLGRIPYPFLARRGDRGLSRIGWDEALALAGQTLADLDPDRTGFLAGTRGLTNEALYGFGKAARLLGSNNLDLCQSPNQAAILDVLGTALGREASTCSVNDLIGADLVVLCGTRTAQDQPALARVLRAARSAGTRIVALNAHADVGWADDAFAVRSPSALLAATLRLLQDANGLDQAFLEAHVTAWKTVFKAVRGTSLDDWLTAAGARREQAEWLATLIGRTRTWVSVVGPDPAAMAALVALHLGQGAIGRRQCGILALGGGGNGQGGRDCGISPARFPGGTAVNKARARELGKLWGRPVPHTRGLDLEGQLDAGAAGELDALILLCADPLTVLGTQAEAGLARVGLRVHLATHLDPSMLVDPADTVLVLPLETTHEQTGGGTLTSVERRVRWSPQVQGHRSIGLARPAWQVPGQIAATARPELSSEVAGQDPASLRQEIRRAVPDYDGLQVLAGPGDWFQWGGPQLYREGAFQTRCGKARMPDIPSP